MCGKGVAMRARGAGAHVIVTEINPIRAIEAVMDGYEVMPMAAAAPLGDVFLTVTGNKAVVRKEHFRRMKDGAIVANAGHFNVEIDIPALESLSSGKRRVREFVDEYTLQDGRRINLLGEGRLINLAAAEGHPAMVMDMSFANQALSVSWLLGQAGGLAKSVFPVPQEIDEEIAALKLASMGSALDKLTPAQKKYLAEWREGT
jgi:adenosylhomocysteinase